MPPENDNIMNHLEDEPSLDDEGSGQPTLLAMSVNHNEQASLAIIEIVADADDGIISSSNNNNNHQVSSGHIPEATIASSTSSSSNFMDHQSINNTQSLMYESFYPASRDIDQEVSSSLAHQQYIIEAATVEPETLAEIHGHGLENSPATSHTAADGVAASLVLVRDIDEEEEEKREIEEEEKEEIPPTFAVIPPDFSAEEATVLGEPARLFHDDIDPWQQATELSARKQMSAIAAAYGGGDGGGGCGGDCSAGSQVADLEPLDGEDALDFYKRNRNFWTISAAEFLVSHQEAALVSVANLKTQGMRLAEDYFNAAKTERAAAGVAISTNTAAAASRQGQQQQHQSCNPTAAGRRCTQFELGPLVEETVENFSSRTQHFWTMQAAESLAREEAPVCIDTLNLESSRLAREYWAMNHQLTTTHHQAILPNDLTQQATIVEITDEHHLHPLEMSHDAVRAEFVGQDFSRSSTRITALDTASSTEAVAVQRLAVGNQVDDDDMTTEATVIDSAPLAKEESQEAWRGAEEAQVLEEGDSSTMSSFLDDRKPAAVDRAALDQTGGDFAVAEQEAEVLAIQEEIHPFEFVDEQNEAHAQVVGQVYTVVADEHVSSTLLTGDNVMPATATSEEDQATAEVHAVASPVTYNDNGQATEVHAVASPIAAPREQNQVVDAQVVVSPAPTDQGQETHAHAVASHSLSTEQDQTREIHAVVVEQVPPTPTATAVATTANPFEDDPNDTPAMSRDGLAALDAQYDDSWMRTPSLASHDLPPVAVLAPPDHIAWSLEDVSENTHGGDDVRENPPPRSSSAAGVDENCDAFIRTSSSSLGSEPTHHPNRRNQLHSLSGNLARGLSATGNVMEALFGDTKAPFVGRKPRASQDEVSNAVLPRTLLPWTVIYSDASRMWVVTIQCSQKALDRNHNKCEASKALRAFSLPTEKQAMCLGLAWTPPRMLPFEDNPLCHICNSRFAILRRACHCRNCGVCICKDCTVAWPAKMVPDTYNTKKASAVNVCRSCDWLCNGFRLALLNGNRDEAVALHATGNINLTSPFNNVKGEIFYPVHASALGGSLELLRWLVDDHCCPIKSVRLSGPKNASSDRYTPIVTSKGRSLLGIAMANGNVHMVRYLIVNKHLSIEAEKDITPAMVLRNLEKALCLLPETVGSDTTGGPAAATSPESPAFSSLVAGDYNDMSPIPPSASLFQDERTLSQEARDFGAILQHRPIMGDGENNGGENHDDDDECIICYDAKIDCVATPCGHQMCCLKCSKNFIPPKCPVCAQECSFLRVFR